MTIQNANEIVRRLGPCRIAIDRDAHPELARELALTGCDVVATGAETGKGAVAGYLAWTGADPRTFPMALRAFPQVDALVLQSAGQDRDAIEAALFGAGWQRHPGGMTADEYPQWSRHRLPTISYYKRALPGSKTLRTGGMEADAAIARHAMAATLVRPGDHVLVEGRDSGDGAAVLAALSRAGTITRAAAGERAETGRVEPDLAALADRSIDLIVAFEPSTPRGWIARLDDYARVLKHDGRVMLGWRRGGGGDAARPRDWATLAGAVSERFLTEKRFLQIPVDPDSDGPRTIFPIAVEEDCEAEWMLVSASANPLAGAEDPIRYDHPAFPRSQGAQPVLVDFGAAYDNPHLYRTMVQMGERLGDDLKLARLAECVIEASRDGSADRGAAIAVLGYRVLEMRVPDPVPLILTLIGDYVDATPPGANLTAHVCRWRISLAFLAARLSEMVGDRDAARRWYHEVTQSDWSQFSPLLATKAVAACFYEARLCLSDGDPDAAQACFRRGLDIALAAAAAPHADLIGPADRPLPFYMQELAEVIDMGSQCANALAHFPLWRRDPGLFWRQVDIRRFGLATWARDVELENQRLRAA